MTYAEAVARVLALRGGEHPGMRPGLERIETLLEALGHPERAYTLVQVGGTNGKGSVSAMLAAMLGAAGRRVGLYTSPHLVSFRERIRVDGAPIPEDAVVDGVDAIGTLVARLDASMFEATTALALDHFARESVDVAVLEVGLGGRLDATTVGTPAVTVITRIARDHEAVLGSDLATIAGEKAAIIRSGVAVSARQAPEAMEVVRARARAARVPLLEEGRDLAVRVVARDLTGQRLECRGPDWRLDDVHLALLGTYQPGNAVLAVAAARVLGVPEAAMRAGLARVRWPGRFEVRPRADGWLVLDGAHNPDGAAALRASLEAYFPGAPLALVVGMYADKDARGILGALAPLATRIVLTRTASPRAADPAALRDVVSPGPVEVIVAASPVEALRRAEEGGRARVVCVAGSLALLGDVLRHLDGDKPCRVENAAASMSRPS
ncbi:MAG TPA: folylpolyglutamate synthase/dihydrofolate synthase family protein [Candidatus Tectomicrobia bacterium]|nr:folylpolyglutamate synthase/dihydrofolate synthase family protein [Candidatus Tectomicrobia bacterium]